MPTIIPISDLKNTGAISQMCQEVEEPIFVTKNGYGDMVIMSIKMYEDKMYMLDVYEKMRAAEADVAAGRTGDARQAVNRTREKYNV